MNFHYIDLFLKQLYAVKKRLGVQCEFKVEEEQDFIKRETLDPNTIYIVIKTLQNDIQLNIESQPLQILILSEEGSLEMAKGVFGDFARTYNWKAITVDGVWVKQEYSEPVVLSNFQTFDAGYRSVLYISAMLYIMKDVIDLHNLKVNNESIEVISFDMSYVMTPNTQQMTGTSEFISKSVKAVSALTLNITIPAIKYTLMNHVIGILNETDTDPNDANDSQSFGGNENFNFDFYLGEIHFENKKMKLISCNFGTVINDAPAIRLGFVL